MHQLLNTLFVQTQGAYVRLDHETVKLEVQREEKMQIPMHHLGGMVIFGNVLVSPFLLHRFAEDGRNVVWMGQSGRFKGRLAGPTSGNVLLRRDQYRAQADPAQAASVARSFVMGKVRNSRSLIRRSSREQENGEALDSAASSLSAVLRELERASDLDDVRGLEGRAGRVYFDAFSDMIRADNGSFSFNGRSRRPPRDPVNALLSFVYALVLEDCVAACEGVGLDPQFGFLHALRPGRPSLALDLIEELRSVLADRLVLALINRKQIQSKNFVERPGGAIHLNDEGRKVVLVAYQKRKQEEINHPVLDRQMPLGLIPHVQARLLARHLRGDTDYYPPYVFR